MQPREDVLDLIARQGLPKLGPKSITDPTAFLAQLDLIRKTGYAVNDEETDANVRFVGVSIPNLVHGETTSLILGAPADRLSISAIPDFAGILREAAGYIADVA